MSGPRLLAVKLADFGDALLTTPAIAALRARWPQATIDVLTTPSSAVVYRHGPHVDDVLTFEKGRGGAWLGPLARPLGPWRLARTLRRRRYDTVVSFHHLTTRAGVAKHAALALATGAPTRAGLARPGAWRGWFLTHAAEDKGFDGAHEVEANLAVAAALGVPPAGRALVFEPGGEAMRRAESLLAPTGRQPTVVVHPGSGPYSVARRWPADGFATVADGLAAAGASVVLVGQPADDVARVRRLVSAPVTDLSGGTDLPTLAAVLAGAALFVGGDSGVMHLATAMGCPVVAVFGPSNAVAWGPWRPTDHAVPEAPEHRVVGLDLPCRPCLYVGHRLGDRRGCPTRDCLAWLPPGRVLDAALSALDPAGAR